VTERFDWRKHLAVHPAADLFPLMSEAELKELADDIKKNGLIDPLVVWKKGGSLLDGRNRLDAMALAGILGVDSQGRLCNASSIVPIIWHRIGTGDPWSIALSLNVHRRHLSLEQKRDLIAKVLKATPEKSDRQIASITKSDHKTVGKVRAKKEGRGEIPHVDARPDTKGRKQPAKRKGNPPKRDPLDAHTAVINGGPPRTEGSAEISIEQRRAENAELDLSAEERAAKVSACALAEFTAACQTWLPKMTEEDRRKARILVNLDHWRSKAGAA
jgi:hypothetical protein